MPFTKMKLTTFGNTIEAKRHQGKGIHFTRIAIGDGLLNNGSMVNRRSLISERHSMKIDGIMVADGDQQTAVVATLNNGEFSEGFPYRELALMAQDPDTGQEGVYLYDNAGQECEFLDIQENGVIIYEHIKLLIRVEQTEHITFEASGNPLYLSAEDIAALLEAHNLNKEAHPTKADLGDDGIVLGTQLPKMDYIPISDKSKPGGVAALGEDGVLAAGQRPSAEGILLLDGVTSVESSLSNKASIETQRAVFATSAPGQNVTLAASELQAYIDALPRLLTKKYTVRVSGEWAGTLLIRGFYGPGFLRIMSDTPGGCVLTGRAHILECACLIQLENLELRASNDLTTHNHFILGLEGAARANLLYLRITGNGACAGLNVNNQSHCYFADGSISHCSMATQIVGSSVLTVNVVPAEVAAQWTGNGCGAYVFWGGVALLAASAPELLGGSYNNKNGGIIARANGTLL